MDKAPFKTSVDDVSRRVLDRAEGAQNFDNFQAEIVGGWKHLPPTLLKGTPVLLILYQILEIW